MNDNMVVEAWRYMLAGCGCVPILRGEINNYKKTLELIINVSELSQAITLARRALEEVKDE